MIHIDSLCLSYGGQRVLENVDMHIRPGEKVAIMGPSGCGKTSLMKAIGGLIKPESGSVSVDGRLSCVFQEPRLLPWLSAAENINSVLSDCAETMPAALNWLEAVGLGEAAQKRPGELSGGMQQRLSIARALAYGGDILLLDEPLKGMDTQLRDSIAQLIRSHSADKTLVLITHDETEAKTFADRIFVYRDKKFIEE